MTPVLVPCPFDVGGPARKLTSAERRQLKEHCGLGLYAYPEWKHRLSQERPPLTLTSRWTPLIPHPEQLRLMLSRARFKIVVAGRRSGKSERIKRLLVMAAMGPQRHARTRYVYAAPTLDQAKAIAWQDLKDLVPRWAMAGRASESELTIRLKNGAEIVVVGMNEARRIEGRPIDGIVLDEYAEMKPDVWTSTVRPMLSEMGREGWVIFLGRPKGRNHFWKLVNQFGLPEEVKDWDYFHWRSSDLLDPREVASARETLDVLSYLQEYEAEFVLFEGRAYYAFERELHAVEQLRYDPTLPLVVCFDFNVEPGVACYLQEQQYQGTNPRVAPGFTAVLGEVWIPRNSNTEIVSRRIIADWGKGGAYAHHQGEIRLYGDPSGGARKTSGVEGSDWDIIRNTLREAFADKVVSYVRNSPPGERDRINAVNTRLRTTAGTIRMLIDPKRAPHVADDLENVALIAGGSGEIDKPKKGKQSDLTHISDALGYYVEDKWPTSAAQSEEERAALGQLEFG